MACVARFVSVDDHERAERMIGDWTPFGSAFSIAGPNFYIDPDFVGIGDFAIVFDPSVWSGLPRSRLPQPRERAVSRKIRFEKIVTHHGFAFPKMMSTSPHLIRS